METASSRAAAVEQSVWELGVSWCVVEICLLAAEIVFFALRVNALLLTLVTFYLALAGNVSD